MCESHHNPRFAGYTLRLGALSVALLAQGAYYLRAQLYVAVAGCAVLASVCCICCLGLFGFFVDVWIDLGGDGACTTGTDPIYNHFVSNTFTDPIVSTFKPGATPDKTDCSKVGLR